MFDANMRHLPKGKIFVAEIWGLTKGSLLGKAGYKEDDLILLEKLSDESDETSAVTLCDRKIEVLNSTDLNEWLVFHGSVLNGKIFNTIDNSSKTKNKREKLMQEYNQHKGKFKK